MLASNSYWRWSDRLGHKMRKNREQTTATLTEGLVTNLVGSGTKSSCAVFTLDEDVCLTRRALLLGILLGGLQLAASGTTAQASAINPSETQITLPDAIKWTPWGGASPHGGG